MIIIEEDDEDKREIQRIDDDDILDEKLTTEEYQYKSAVSLMESVECVTRFEHKVKSMRDAADRFEALGDYEDSAALAAECRAQADKLEETGREEAYQGAVVLCEEAGTKMEYRTAISELERVTGYKDSDERIELCRQEIARLETKTAWRNRAIAFVLVVLFALAVWGGLSLL